MQGAAWGNIIQYDMWLVLNTKLSDLSTAKRLQDINTNIFVFPCHDQHHSIHILSPNKLLYPSLRNTTFKKFNVRIYYVHRNQHSQRCSRILCIHVSRNIGNRFATISFCDRRIDAWRRAYAGVAQQLVPS